ARPSYRHTPFCGIRCRLSSVGRQKPTAPELTRASAESAPCYKSSASSFRKSPVAAAFSCGGEINLPSKALGLCHRAHQAESHIFGRRPAIRSRICWTIRASAFQSTFSIRSCDPLSHIAAQVKHRLLVLLPLPGETPHRLQQRRVAAKFFHLLAQAVSVIRIRRVTCPIIQRVFSVLFVVPAGRFFFRRQPPALPGQLGEPLGVCLGLVEHHAVCWIVLRARLYFVALVESRELRAGQFKAAHFHVAPL